MNRLSLRRASREVRAENACAKAMEKDRSKRVSAARKEVVAALDFMDKKLYPRTWGPFGGARTLTNKPMEDALNKATELLTRQEDRRALAAFVREELRINVENAWIAQSEGDLLCAVVDRFELEEDPERQAEEARRLMGRLDEVLAAQVQSAIPAILREHDSKIVTPEARTAVVQALRGKLGDGAADGVLAALDDFAHRGAIASACREADVVRFEVDDFRLGIRGYPLQEVRQACATVSEVFEVVSPPSRRALRDALATLVDSLEVTEGQRISGRRDVFDAAVQVTHPITGAEVRVLDAHPVQVLKSLEKALGEH